VQCSTMKLRANSDTDADNLFFNGLEDAANPGIL
jgi:hypothetical protein